MSNFEKRKYEKTGENTPKGQMVPSSRMYIPHIQGKHIKKHLANFAPRKGKMDTLRPFFALYAGVLFKNFLKDVASEGPSEGHPIVLLQSYQRYPKIAERTSECPSLYQQSQRVSNGLFFKNGKLDGLKMASFLFSRLPNAFKHCAFETSKLVSNITLKLKRRGRRQGFLSFEQLAFWCPFKKEG